MSPTDTSIFVDDINLFPDAGTIQIDSEQMTYSGKQPIAGTRSFHPATAPQPGALLNVQRGANGTSRGPHEDGAMVVLILPPCVGDCDGGGSVTVNELITMVNIALGVADLSTCRVGDLDGSGTIEVNEIIAAVNNALNNCPTS